MIIRTFSMKGTSQAYNLITLMPLRISFCKKDSVEYHLHFQLEILTISFTLASLFPICAF